MPNKADDVNRYISKCCEILNFSIQNEGTPITPETPLRDILRPEVLGPETLLVGIAGSMGRDLDEIDQSRIDPETDTVASAVRKVSGFESGAARP